MDYIGSDLLNNIKIISNIPAGGRLDCSCAGLNVYTPGFKKWLVRYMTGDSRERTINRLVKIFKELKVRVNIIIKIVMLNVDNKAEEVKFDGDIQSALFCVNKLPGDLTDAIKGLRNLKETYAKDIEVSSKIELIITNTIASLLKDLRRFNRRYKSFDVTEDKHGKKQSKKNTNISDVTMSDVEDE